MVTTQLEYQFKSRRRSRLTSGDHVPLDLQVNLIQNPEHQVVQNHQQAAHQRVSEDRGHAHQDSMPLPEGQLQGPCRTDKTDSHAQIRTSLSHTHTFKHAHTRVGTHNQPLPHTLFHTYKMHTHTRALTWGDVGVGLPPCQW